MYKLFSLLTISLLLFSCSNSGKQNQNSKTKEKTDISKNSYAVVWDWDTKDKKLINENAAAFTKELSNLWEKNIIENVYFDSEAKGVDDMQFPSISFFIKANSLDNAKSILDGLTIVRQEIAQYKLYPVGMLWLGQNKETSEKNKTLGSFVTIWEPKGKKPDDDLLKAQNDKILALWNSGTIENVYLDLEGISGANDKTDFVFYVKADNRNDAETICKSLPFYKENIASYQIFSAGTFWMGISE